MLQLPEDEFSSLKILPIKIITAARHLGIDINLRPVGRMLERQKTFVDSHYFLVVDDHSRSTKIRVGAKIYAFRGPSQLAVFIDSLSKNPIRSNIQPIEK